MEMTLCGCSSCTKVHALISTSGIRNSLSYESTKFHRYCKRAKAVFKELELKQQPYVVELDQRGLLYIIFVSQITVLECLPPTSVMFFLPCGSVTVSLK